MEKITISFTDDYFISNAHKLIFCLLELDGHCRAKHLGIHSELFNDSELLDEWLNDIKNVIKSSNFEDDIKNKALKKLSKLYGDMK